LLAGKEDSPVARELKLALEDSGIAGLSCNGQVRKLSGILGHIIAKKHGKDGKLLSGLNDDDNQQAMGSNFVNEA
jgi:hypothetical protein